MSNAKRQLHLNAFIMANGHHEAAWRHPDTDPKQALTLQHCAEIAQTAEPGKLDSLDHLSVGRAGWNIVTSAGNAEAQNFNRDSRPDHERRYERATEFIEVAKKLWDSWDDDAAVIERLAGGRGHRVFAGIPIQIADQLEQWFTDGAADGFNVMPPKLPGGLDDFVSLVVPELQRRGLFGTEYTGATLREQYGLARPTNQFRQQPNSPKENAA